MSDQRVKTDEMHRAIQRGETLVDPFVSVLPFFHQGQELLAHSTDQLLIEPGSWVRIRFEEAPEKARKSGAAWLEISPPRLWGGWWRLCGQKLDEGLREEREKEEALKLERKAAMEKKHSKDQEEIEEELERQKSAAKGKGADADKKQPEKAAKGESKEAGGGAESGGGAEKGQSDKEGSEKEKSEKEKAEKARKKAAAEEAEKKAKEEEKKAKEEEEKKKKDPPLSENQRIEEGTAQRMQSLERGERLANPYVTSIGMWHKYLPGMEGEWYRNAVRDFVRMPAGTRLRLVTNLIEEDYETKKFAWLLVAYPELWDAWARAEKVWTLWEGGDGRRINFPSGSRGGG